MAKTERELYYGQALGQVWSYEGYRTYEKAYWDWHVLPFADDHSKRNPTFVTSWKLWPGTPRSARSRLGFSYSPDRITRRVVGKSILEVGSAMGAAYGFMKESGLVELSRYTGFEVSDMGHQRSKRMHPEANWVQGDFTKHALTQRYDYSFERHAVHHMPSPVEQYEKMIAHTDLAVNVVFVGTLYGETISDLNKAAYRYSDQGVYYFNVINLLDVVRIGLREGFNHIRVCYYGEHEACSTEPNAEQFMLEEIQRAGVQRYMVRMAKCPSVRRPLLYAFPWRPGLRSAPALRALRGELQGLAEKHR